MKKVIFSALALSIIVFSCNKENIQPDLSNTNTGTTESQLNKTTSDQVLVYNDILSQIDTETILFLKENNIESNQDQKLPKWIEVALADIAGALTGGFIGYEVGGNGGAIIGGVGIGVSASVGVSRAVTDNNGNTNILYNEANPYEAVGKTHYLLVEEARNGNSNWYSDETINYTLFLDRAFDVIKAESLDCDNSKICIDAALIESHTQTVLNSNYNNIKNYSNRFNYSSEVKAVFYTYFKSMLKLKNYPSIYFANYSIIVENIIINSNVNQQDKLFLLLNMSTARVGFQYWK